MKKNICILCILSLTIAFYGCSSSTGDNDGGKSLPAPSDVTVELIEKGTASLSWSPVADEGLKGYYVYWNAGAAVDSLTSFRRFIETNEVEITGLDCETTYYFAVTSIDEFDNESILSAQVSGKCETTSDLSPPPGPSGLEFTSIGNGAVSLRWSPVDVDDLKGYNVYWRGGAKADTLSANRMFIQGTSVTISNLDYEILYYFAVTAIDTNGNESVFSVQLSGTPFNTTSPSPPASVNVAAENVDVPKINIFWEQNIEPDISHYNVYRALSAAGLDDSSTAFVSSVFEPYYIDSDVEVGITYYFRITAVDKGNLESTPSSIVSDKILPSVDLVSPINYQYTDDAPTFRWEPVEGAEKYVLTLMESRIGGEIWYTEINKNTTEISYTGSSTLISGNTYYWRVGAITKSEINSESKVGAFVVKTE